MTVHATPVAFTSIQSGAIQLGNSLFSSGVFRCVSARLLSKLNMRAKGMLLLPFILGFP